MSEKIQEIVNHYTSEAIGETAAYRTACYLHACMLILAEIAKSMEEKKCSKESLKSI